MSPKRHCRTEPDATPAMTGESAESETDSLFEGEQDGSEAEAVDLGEESETDSLFRSSPDEMPTAPARDTQLRPAAKARTGRPEEGGLPTTPAQNLSIAWNGVPPYISPAGPPPPSRSGTDFPLPGTRPMHEAAPPVYTPGERLQLWSLTLSPGPVVVIQGVPRRTWFFQLQQGHVHNYEGPAGPHQHVLVSPIHTLTGPPVPVVGYSTLEQHAESGSSAPGR